MCQANQSSPSEAERKTPFSNETRGTLTHLVSLPRPICVELRLLNGDWQADASKSQCVSIRGKQRDVDTNHVGRFTVYLILFIRALAARIIHPLSAIHHSAAAGL